MKPVSLRMLFGAVAGLLATGAMSIFMLAARRAGWLHEQAPEEITERTVEQATHHRIGGQSLDVLAAIAHLGFGASAGVLYAFTLGRWRVRSVPPILTGVLYGTSVWLGSYWGVLPRLGLMPSPPDDEQRRPLVMLVAHWIYGAALGLTSPQAEQAARDQRPSGRTSWSRLAGQLSPSQSAARIAPSRRLAWLASTVVGRK